MNGLPNASFSFVASGPSLTTSARSGRPLGLRPAVTPEAVSGMNLRDRVVLYVHDYGKPVPANATQVNRAIRLSKPKAIVAASPVANASGSLRRKSGRGSSTTRRRSP